MCADASLFSCAWLYYTHARTATAEILCVARVCVVLWFCLQPDWTVRGDHIEFAASASRRDAERGRVGAADAPGLIKSMLHYATEVERIV